MRRGESDATASPRSSTCAGPVPISPPSSASDKENGDVPILMDMSTRREPWYQKVRSVRNSVEVP